MKTQQLTLAMAEGIYVFYSFQNINVVDCYTVNFSKITATQQKHNTTSRHGGRGGGEERLSIGRASTNQSPLRMRNTSASRLPLRFGPV